MKSAQGYIGSWRLKIFLFLALAAILFIEATLVHVESLVDNIPEKFESHRPEGLTKYSI